MSPSFIYIFCFLSNGSFPFVHRNFQISWSRANPQSISLKTSLSLANVLLPLCGRYPATFVEGSTFAHPLFSEKWVCARAWGHTSARCPGSLRLHCTGSKYRLLPSTPKASPTGSLRAPNRQHLLSSTDNSGSEMTSTLSLRAWAVTDFCIFHFSQYLA